MRILDNDICTHFEFWINCGCKVIRTTGQILTGCKCLLIKTYMSFLIPRNFSVFYCGVNMFGLAIVSPGVVILCPKCEL